jgi:tetratricopeptide (TPR) repeat protein
MKIVNQRRTRTLALALTLSAMLATTTLADFDDGMNFFKSGKYAESAAEFQALVDSSPEYGFGYYMLGLSFKMMKKYPEAATNLKKAIEIDGQKFSYAQGLASVYRNQGKNLDALKTLNAVEDQVDGQTEQGKYAFYSLRGFAAADLDKWSDAVDDLEKARKMKPQSAAVNFYLGTAYYKLGYYDKATPILRDAVAADPNRATTHMLLADSLLNLGRETREESQKKALYVEAVQRAEKYRSLKPKDYRAANLVGKAALGARDYKKAEAAFQQVLEMKPDHCYAMVNLSKGYIAQERWKAAENILEKAAKCAPRMAVVYDSLGFALQKQGRLADSKAAYEKSLSIKEDAGVRGRLDIVVQNMRINQENLDAEAEVARLEEEARKAEEEYQKELAKQKEWEKKRDE